MRILFLFFGLSLFSCFSAHAQRSDSTRRVMNGLRPYRDLISSKAISDHGLFTVHKLDEKYYLEIPDSLFEREILVVNRISKAAAGMRIPGSFFGYGGDQIGQNVIRFEKGPGNKIFIRNISYADYARDSSSPMFTAVNNSNIQQIAAAFDMKSLGKDSSGAVIDFTDFVNADNDILYFSPGLKNAFRIGAQQPDKSYISSIRSFPINMEVRVVKTYYRAATGPATGGAMPPSGNLTMELNSSFVLLPKVPMQARYFDPRVGYFSVGYTDYDANPQGIKKVRLVKRWRLEPKDSDWEKYMRGEPVEPKKPIIFYIDPATPKKWIPYLIQGVNDWQVCFEKAGFKNAIMARLAPTKEEDSTWSLDDARNSAIVYKPSDIANASGPSTADPRSGEILESHINWYHNVMELIHDWYFVQCAAVDPRARKMVFDDELMGRLIRFVSSHEVGHTLGLLHNFGASSAVPVQNLRNKAWLMANGHTPSIMDYARFNYVAQPEDSIPEEGLMARIGDYDKWAIEWGYRLFPQYRSADAEKSHLNQWVIGKLRDKKYWFGVENNSDDPRSQNEQVGDDPMLAGVFGIKNLQRITAHLSEWTSEPGEDYSNLKKMYAQVVNQYRYYITHVLKFVGGIMETPKTQEQDGPVYEVVPALKQKEAVEFLNQQVFNTPVWLLDADIFGKTGENGLKTVGGVHDYTISRLLNRNTLGKLLDAEAGSGGKTYRITDLFSDLKKGVWGELTTRKPIDMYRRGLQKTYINALVGLLTTNTQPISSAGISISIIGGGPDKTDIRSVVMAELESLRSSILAAAAQVPDAMSRYHLRDLASRIYKALNDKE